MVSLKGKVIIITGASGGVGQIVTDVLAKSGAHVIAVSRQKPSNVAKDTIWLTADATKETEVQRLFMEVAQQTTRIDGLINLIGGYAPAQVRETDTSTWSNMLALNLTSAFLLSRETTKRMCEQHYGHIVHIAAHAATRPSPGAAAYIVSKAGLVALIKVLALEVEGSGVTVNGILPTMIDTPANRRSMPEPDFDTWVQPQTDR